MIGKDCAYRRVDVFDRERKAQLQQINLVFLGQSRAWEERVDSVGQFHRAYSQECHHEDHAYYAESSTDVRLKVWTFIERKLDSLTEEV